MNKNNRLVTYLLVAIQAFIGLTAIAGGFRLVTNPNGIQDFPIEWLTNSPFTNYFIPGLALLIVIGFGNVSAGIVTVLHQRYAGIISIVFGISLVLYMIIEVWFIGLRTALQPLYFILGVIESILGLKLSEFVQTASQMYIESTKTKLPT